MKWELGFAYFIFSEKMEIGSLGLMGIKNVDWVGKLDLNPASSQGRGIQFHLNI